jgi:hypothetical protein
LDDVQHGRGLRSAEGLAQSRPILNAPQTPVRRNVAGRHRHESTP